MSSVTRKPISLDMTLKEIVDVSVDALTDGQQDGVFQVAGVLVDGPKVVITVRISAEIVAEFPTG